MAVVSARTGCDSPNETRVSLRRQRVRRHRAVVFPVVPYDDGEQLEDVEAAARPDMVSLELGLELVALMDVAQ